MYPKEFNDLVDMFESISGIGHKAAERYAFDFLNKGDHGKAINIINQLSHLGICPVCGAMTSYGKCSICSDQTRDKNIILVVEDNKCLNTLENSGLFKGQYHVLNGLLSPTKGVYQDDINIEGLLKRLNGVNEVIIALSPSVDGELTSAYLVKLLKEKNIRVSKLATGIPMGASIEYADDLTLAKALMNRNIES